jgi:hypothetical protein
MPRPTLYDDWKARREHLAGLADLSDESRAVEAAVLDFLLRRYRDTAEGTRPARFALQRKFYINHRAIVVLHHLAGGRDTKVATEQQAQARVRAILTRMTRTSARKKKLVPKPFKPAALKREWKGPDEALRMRLCDNNPVNRLLAIVKLSEIGNLHDIGLFLDLLSLQATLDEHPKERAAMLHAMQRLAGLTHTPFHLSF